MCFEEHEKLSRAYHYEPSAAGYCGRRKRSPSRENPDLSKVLSFKPWIGQNIASHAWSAARNCAFLIFTSLLRSASFVSLLHLLNPVQPWSGVCHTEWVSLFRLYFDNLCFALAIFKIGPVELGNFSFWLILKHKLLRVFFKPWVRRFDDFCYLMTSVLPGWLE